MKKLLIVDDELNMQKVLDILFRRENYEVTTVSNGREAVEILDKGIIFDLILSDIKMPIMDGIELLKYLNKSQINIPLILITAYGSITEAVDAMKLGAVDFITKPFNKEDLKNIVYRAIHKEKEKNNKQNKSLWNDKGVIYSSEKIQKIMETVRKIAPSNLSILLTGESGTGKGVIAQAIHNYAFQDSEVNSPFISINCPALPDTLLESELFGYQKGSFTGAAKDFKGKIRLSDGGTLFLDEIGELSLNVQPKLLRFLENKKIMPLGGNTEYSVNTRVICATNKNLKEMVDKGLFREDLFYRINTIIIEVPPLRERKEDILPLANYFLNNLSQELGEQKKYLPDSIIKSFLEYKWPGNVRELRNIIERAVLLSGPECISLNDIPVELRYQNTFDEYPSNNQIESSERKMLLSSLLQTGWNITTSAKKLGLTRSTMRYKIIKYQLEKNQN